MEVSASHMSDSYPLKLADQRWSEAVTLLTMPQTTKAIHLVSSSLQRSKRGVPSSAPRKKLSTGIQGRCMRGTASHDANLLTQERLNDSWVHLIVLITVSQPAVDSLTPSVHVIAICKALRDSRSEDKNNAYLHAWIRWFGCP